MQRQHRLTQKIAHDVIASEASHRTGVLARHNRIVRAVYGQPRDIPGGEFGRHALDLEVRIDRHAAKPVARNRKARRQRIGLHAGAPNHGGCRD
jgi:hypothetical protein